MAIAASIPEPIRTLSQAEKANVLAGCYNCDSECTHDGGCYVSECDTIVGQACGGLNVDKEQECNNGGSLIGECETPERQFCCTIQKCKCHPEVGEEITWYCEHKVYYGTIPFSKTYSKDPC